MNLPDLTPDQRHAMNCALNEGCDFNGRANEADYKNLLNACNALGLDGSSYEAAFSAKFPGAYRQWSIGNAYRIQIAA